MPKNFVFDAFQSIGYEEEPIENRADGLFHFKQSDKDSDWPETMTISYPEVAVDGSLWFETEIIVDLLDRLSKTTKDEGVVVRLIKKLEREEIKVTVSRMGGENA